MFQYRPATSAFVALLALGLLASSQWVRAAGFSPQVYGKLHLSLTDLEEEGEGSTPTSRIRADSHTSRVGFKGSAEVAEGLEAGYRLEYQVDVSNDNATQFRSRNTVLWIEGGFGLLHLGHHDTAFKQAQGKVDLFNDLQGDIRNLFYGELRVPFVLRYQSPTVVGLQLRVDLIEEEQGDPTPDELGERAGLGEYRSLSLTYDGGDLYVALALDQGIYQGGPKPRDPKLRRDNTRLAARWAIGPATLGVLWQRGEPLDDALWAMNGTGAPPESGDGFLVSLAFKLGEGSFKLQHGTSSVAPGVIAGEREQSSLGYDYKLDKKFKLFVYTTDRSDPNEDFSALGVGAELKF